MITGISRIQIAQSRVEVVSQFGQLFAFFNALLASVGAIDDGVAAEIATYCLFIVLAHNMWVQFVPRKSRRITFQLVNYSSICEPRVGRLVLFLLFVFMARMHDCFTELPVFTCSMILLFECFIFRIKFARELTRKHRGYEIP